MSQQEIGIALILFGITLYIMTHDFIEVVMTFLIVVAVALTLFVYFAPTP